MKNFILNNRGFGVVSIIAVLAVALIITGTGYVIFNKTRTAPVGAATPSVAPPAPKAPTTKPTPTSAVPAEIGATLTIKEWGIEVPLPDSLKDAYYVPSIGSADPDGSMNTVWLGLKSRDTEICGAALGNTGGSVIGDIVRALPTDTDPVTGKLYSELYSGVVIGKYFYGYGAFVNPDNKCGSVASRTELNASFAVAAKNAKAVSAQADN